MATATESKGMKRFYKLNYVLSPNPSSHSLLIYAESLEKAREKAEKTLRLDYEGGTAVLLPHFKEFRAEQGDLASMSGTDLFDNLSHSDISEYMRDLQQNEQKIGFEVKTLDSNMMSRAKTRLKAIEIRTRGKE